jgi:hypothetical protein
MILTGETDKLEGKSVPSATLYTTHLTWTDLESNLILRSERLTLATERPV